MPPKPRARVSEPLGRESSYYGDSSKDHQMLAAQNAAQRLKALRVVVFAAPLLVVSSVSGI